MNESGPNPYAAPIASPAASPNPVDVETPRWSSVAILAFLFGAVAGGAFVEQASVGLQRFGGEEYVPRVLLLRATRGTAGAPAAIAVTFLGISALHRTANATPERWPQLARWSFIATLAVTLPSYCGMLVAAVMASLVHGISPSLYADAARTTLTLTDPLVGLALASAYGVLAAVLLSLGRRAWTSTMWPLAAKWFVAFWVSQIGWAGVWALVSLAV